MKLEYLPDGSPDCPLIRVFDFTQDEARLLQVAVLGLAQGQPTKVALHDLSFVEALGGCRLTLEIGQWNQGTAFGASRVDFVCRLTSIEWENVALLIEPFANGGTGYQWLVERTAVARLLLSPSGEW